MGQLDAHKTWIDSPMLGLSSYRHTSIAPARLLHSILEPILHKMFDASSVSCDPLHTTSERGDDAPSETLRPETPVPDDSRTLRRTMSYASIATIRPSSTKGIRRRINEIADGLKYKATQKNKKHPSTHGVPRGATRDLTSDSKAPPESKATRRGRKSTTPLRDLSRRFVGESALADDDSPEREPSSTVLGRGSELLVEKPLAKEDAKRWEDHSLPILNLTLGARFVVKDEDTSQSPRVPKLGVKDVQLDIRPSESDVTIWDGLQATHQLFKCRMYLRCTAYPYDVVSLPDIHRVEVHCNTRPAGSRYAGPPVLQATYGGASPGLVTKSSEPPKVNPTAGIHMDRLWCAIRDDDGTWGWYRDAFVPLSPRLFDKMEYREFKLVGRVWLGESCVENELTFGISMLLREVDMR